MKCICKTCGDKKSTKEMLIHSITKLPTEVCLACVVAKRAATRLTNSPKAPHVDVQQETRLNAQIKLLISNLKIIGRNVHNVLLERGKDGLELVLKYTQVGEQRIHLSSARW